MLSKRTEQSDLPIVSIPAVCSRIPKYKKEERKHCFRSSSLWIRLLLQHIQHERQDDERSADPLGGTRKTGIRALGLVLGHERIGHAADRTA